MSKIKRTTVPLPGSTSKSPAKPVRAPSKPPLSQEFIESSDDSATEATPRKKTDKKTEKPKPTINIAVHRPKTNGVAKKPEKTTSKPTPAPKEAVKPAQETSSSSEESEEESESASDPDSSSDESEGEPAPIATPQAAPSQPQQAQSHTIDFRPTKAYVPPKDYTAIPTPFTTSSPATRLFENLEGKQIWHITAPSHVPLSTVKELAMDKALEGSTILSHDGMDYSFSAQEKDDQARNVLIPQQRGFKAVPTRITRTLHLQQKIRLPTITPHPPTVPPATSFITSSTLVNPRPQVKGLKMNFFPSGHPTSERCTLGSSDSETEAPAGKKEKPRKRALEKDERAAEREGSPMKKSKKHRTPEEIKRREEKKARKEKRKERAKS